MWAVQLIRALCVSTLPFLLSNYDCQQVDMFNCYCIALMLLFVVVCFAYDANCVDGNIFHQCRRDSAALLSQDITVAMEGLKETDCEKKNNNHCVFYVNDCCPILVKIRDRIRKALLDNLHNGVASSEPYFPDNEH